MSRILEPFGERIIVKQLTVDQIGSIILPEQAKKKSIEGRVVAIGKDAEEIGWVQVGDIVMYGRHAGFELPSEAGGYKDCRLMNVEDLLAKIVERPDEQTPSPQQEGVMVNG